MTDATVSGRSGFDVMSDAARQRLAKRYAAERRFKMYGMAAIGFAGVFLVVLMADIILKALPAFMQSRLVLPVTLTAEDLDPSGSKDLSKIALEGNFIAPVRATLQTLVPSADSRAERRLLNGLISAGGDAGVRQAVMADVNAIGREIRVPVLLSDDADLYLSGRMTKRTVTPGSGDATPSAADGDIELTSTANAFSDLLAGVKQVLAAEAERADFEADEFGRALAAQESNLKLATERLASVRATAPDRVAQAEGELAKVTSDVESLKRTIADRRARAQELRTRSQTADGAEVLDSSVPSVLVKINKGVIKVTELSKASVKGTVLITLASTTPARAGEWQVQQLSAPESARKLSDQEIAYIGELQEAGVVERVFNWAFFTTGDSREAELAGIWGALVGSALTMLVTLSLVLPIGVMAAIYLEEFAPKNRITDFIEININNLAAVPSIVFGLLGLAVFLATFGMPRSAPIVGGLVLALLTLPTIIIASRAALKAVPPSIREAALGVGASHKQAVFHHVLPLAMPGIMTGTIIGMAHALGETAPLLMIGMVAFIVDVPTSVTSAATVLPVQIYLWSDLPEVGFQAKTAAAIIVLLVFLFIMNGLAILLRKRFERRW